MSRIETIHLEWFSVDEKLPSNYKHIIARYKDNGGCNSGQYIDGDLYWTNDYYDELTELYNEWCYNPFE